MIEARAVVHRKAIVLGASAGALEAISELLEHLPSNFPLPIFAVVHLPADKKSLLADCLRERFQREIKEAEDKEPIQEGAMYFAPPDYHLLIEQDGRLSLSTELPVHFSRPSIDVLFESAADVYGPALIGVILTGSNDDGAKGLRMVFDAGGMVLVQCPELAQAREMPLAAIKDCPKACAMTIPEIAACIQKEVRAK